ncbi:Transcription factor [Penicillium cf. griseofulvum]|nr:Transcription factor [Penicillium cf. griseofulvum]KAJ5447728.1 Transcription factor [Penicillium cf. griseofulvum]
MKVAIPRQRSVAAPSSSKRVSRACEACRQRKQKCNGKTPSCRQCEEAKIPCVYPLKSRERITKQIRSLQEKLEDYETTLKEVVNQIQGEPAEHIKDVLQKYNSNSDYVSNGMPDVSHDQTRSRRSSSPSSIGSLEAVDRVDEDLNLTKSSRATGYLGKSSEVTWMGRVEEETELRGRDQSPKSKPEDYTTEKIAPSEVNYHIDDLGIDAPGPVHMYWVPPQPLADHLFETYLHAVHPHFPIINKTLFSTQYRDFFDDISYAGDKWMAILNMIFAIATEYLYNSDESQRGNIKDHLFYLTRARMLSMDGDTLFEHPDLEQVQVEGLVAFHMLCTNQINRAWRISALAIRSATSLGINLKSSSQKMSGITKEIPCRVWWCLYMVEHTLGSMTGRATSISTDMYTAQLPLPFDEDHLSEPPASELLDDLDLREKRLNMAMTSPHLRHPERQQTEAALAGRLWLQTLPVNHSLYFLYFCDLTVLNQEIINRVYSVYSATISWEDIKSTIKRLKETVDAWLSNLPPRLDFTSMKDENQETYWAKTNLAFHYYSTHIMLGRPCLCRHNPNRSEEQRKRLDQRGFSHDMAVMTLESAMHTLDLLPDEPSSAHLYHVCPWWCFLHYIMQTAAVIILELSFGCVHMKNRESSLVQSAKKSVHWLYMMSKHCTASYRAWRLCESAVRRLVSSMGYDSSDMAAPPNKQSDDPLAPRTQLDKGVEGAYVLPYHAHDPSSTLPHGSRAVDHYNNDLDLTNSLASEFLTTPSTQEHTGGAANFPFDPISEEFIHYFFPSLDGEENMGGEDHTF